MASMKKTFKKYERPILLGIVLILLATFSVTGAVQCGSKPQGGSLKMGGTFNVAPSEQAELSDVDFERDLSETQGFVRAMGIPSREFRQQLFARMPGNVLEETWMQHVINAAAAHAGYQAGDHQTQRAVEDMVGFVLYSQAQLPFSDTNYQNFLRQNYDRSKAEFEEEVRDTVLRDEFLFPLISTARYSTTYAQAYEQWKTQRERINLDYVSLQGTPFAEEVVRGEKTRGLISQQARLLGEVVRAATQVRRVRAEMEAAKKQSGSYPESIDAMRAQPDPWGTKLRLVMEGEEPVVTSAGPDAAFDTADDIAVAVADQMATRRALHEVASLLRVRHTAKKAWPASLEELKEAPGEGQLPGATSLSKDGWEQDLVYAVSGEGDAQSATLSSIGPDGAPGTADDISVALAPDSVDVPLGAGLEQFLLADINDAWGKPLRVLVSRGAPTSFKALSAGPDGIFGNEDDVDTGNETELARFFQQHQTDYRLPLRRNFETILVHLPLVPDALLRTLWEKYPEYRPTSEKALYEHWQLYKGPELFYGAEDPADPKTGHGAELIAEIYPDAQPTLVPGDDVFPAELVDPNAPAGGDDEGNADEGNADEGNADEGNADEGEDGAESQDEEDRRTFLEKGWRKIVLREIFLENVLNGLLKKARENQTAIQKAEAEAAVYERALEAYEKAYAAWEKANVDKPEADRTPKPNAPIKPEVPAPYTFQNIMDEELAPLLADLDPAAPAPFTYWQAGRLLSRKEWEANKDFSDGLKFALDALKEDGQYYGIPVQLNRRKTKVLVRRVEQRAEEDQTLDDVREEVFARFAEWRQMDRAAKELERLKTAAEEAIAALGADADDAARQAAWEGAVQAWGKDLGDAWKLESTGLYIGSTEPPALEITDDMSAEAVAAAERRNFIWRTGYGSVEKSAAGTDDITSAPGTFGRTVLRDYVVKDRDPEIVDGTPQPKDTGTGSAYLVRVKERVFPSKAEFSPRRYVDWLHNDVFGDLRSMRTRKPLREMPGRINQAVAHWFDDFQWMETKFKIKTNSPLETEAQKKKREEAAGGV